MRERIQTPTLPGLPARCGALTKMKIPFSPTFAASAFVLLLLGSTTSTGVAGDKPWDDPSYRKDIPATQAVSRPEPGKSGWHLWMKHHEDRKRWVAGRQVVLLLNGESITVLWSRSRHEALPLCSRIRVG